jgi:VWFA-related protein
MSTVRTGSALAVALLLTAFGVTTPAQQDTPPSFRSGVNAVRVDVIVTDRDGRPIHNLVQEDFEVHEDGAPQTIDRFELVRVDGSTSFLQYAPQPIRSLLDEETEAARPDIALYLLYFTDLYMAPDRAGRILEPLAQFVRDLPAGDMVGTMDPLTPLSAVMLTRDREAIAEEIRRRADMSFRDRRVNALQNLESIQPYPLHDGLEAASLHLASLREGRQSIVLVSSNAPNSRSVYFSDLVKRLNANNTAVYVIDPTGLVPRGGSFQGTSDLHEIAERTGGLAITRTNSIERGLEQIAADGRVQYLLTYASPAPADGRFHEISVRVRRSGARVRARSGFLALSATEMRRAAPPPRPVDQSVRSALAATATAATLVRTWVGTARGENGATRVTLAWEPIPAAVGERRSAPQRVAVTASVGRSTVYTSEDGTSDMLAIDSRLPRSVSFDAPPGDLNVRVEVFANDEVVDVESRVIDVPQYGAAAISTPAVYAGRSAVELRRNSIPDRAPVARREFSRNEQLLVRFEAYGTSAGPRAALLNQSGDRMHEISVADGDGPGRYEITTGVSHLATGDYVLEIVLGDSEETRSLVPIKVRQ